MLSQKWLGCLFTFFFGMIWSEYKIFCIAMNYSMSCYHGNYKYFTAWFERLLKHKPGSLHDLSVKQGVYINNMRWCSLVPNTTFFTAFIKTSLDSERWSHSIYRVYLTWCLSAEVVVRRAAFCRLNKYSIHVYSLLCCSPARLFELNPVVGSHSFLCSEFCLPFICIIPNFQFRLESCFTRCWRLFEQLLTYIMFSVAC